MTLIDLEWLFHGKMHFRPALLESERLNVCDSAVFCVLHDQLASLGRHAQLTRCFSAVAELLVCSEHDRSGQDALMLIFLFSFYHKISSLFHNVGDVRYSALLCL